MCLESSCAFVVIFLSRIQLPPRSTLFPYTTLFRSLSFKRSILKQIVVKTGDGDVEISQCHVNLNLEAKDGDIKIKRSQLTSKNIVKTADGDLRLSHLAHEISVQLKTSDGDIIYHHSNIGNSFNSQNTQSDSLTAVSRDGDIIIS